MTDQSKVLCYDTRLDILAGPVTYNSLSILERLADANPEYIYFFEEPDIHDNVNHPAHHNAYKGLEVIDLTEQLNFNRGNSVKYICRAGLKNPETEIEDLEKAAWYLNREIERVKKALAN